VRKLPPPVAYDADDQTLLAQVIDYYQERLRQTPAALAYLEKRGIRDEEAIKVFRLGFSDRTLGLRLPNKQRVAGAEIRERLERLGVYRESGHEHLNGCLVIPILGPDGRSLGPMAGRSSKTRPRACRSTFTCRGRTGASGTRRASLPVR
jgi:hypothetical protein